VGRKWNLCFNRLKCWVWISPETAPAFSPQSSALHSATTTSTSIRIHSYIHVRTRRRQAPERNKSDAEHRATPRDDCGRQSVHQSFHASQTQLFTLCCAESNRALLTDGPGWIPSHFKKCCAVSTGRGAVTPISKCSTEQRKSSGAGVAPGDPLVQLRDLRDCVLRPVRCHQALYHHMVLFMYYQALYHHMMLFMYHQALYHHMMLFMYHQALYHHIMLFAVTRHCITTRCCSCITRHCITTSCCSLSPGIVSPHDAVHVSPGTVSPHHAVRCHQALYHHIMLFMYHQALYHHIMLFAVTRHCITTSCCSLSPGIVSPHDAVHCHQALYHHMILFMYHQALYHHIMLFTVTRHCITTWCCSLYHQAFYHRMMLFTVTRHCIITWFFSLYHHMLLFTVSPVTVSPHHAVHCHQALYHHMLLFTVSPVTVSPVTVSPHAAVHCITFTTFVTTCQQFLHAHTARGNSHCLHWRSVMTSHTIFDT